MKINEITLNPMMQIPDAPLQFRVGDAPAENAPVVEKINFHPANREFNKGLEWQGPCYAIYFEGIDDRRLIGAEMVTSAEVVKETKTGDNNEAVMPA